jgi:hypothetical protein
MLLIIILIVLILLFGVGHYIGHLTWLQWRRYGIVSR